jgi:hypothetical protein
MRNSPEHPNVAVLAATLFAMTAATACKNTPEQDLAKAINEAIMAQTVDVNGAPPAIETINGETKVGDVACEGDGLLNRNEAVLKCDVRSKANGGLKRQFRIPQSDVKMPRGVDVIRVKPKDAKNSTPR